MRKNIIRTAIMLVVLVLHTTIKIGTQSISRNTLDHDILVCHTGRDKTLAQAGLDPA